MNQEETFVLETIRVMRSTKSSHIFDEVNNTIITTSDENGDKLVILKAK